MNHQFLFSMCFNFVCSVLCLLVLSCAYALFHWFHSDIRTRLWLSKLFIKGKQLTRLQRKKLGLLERLQCCLKFNIKILSRFGSIPIYWDFVSILHLLYYFTYKLCSLTMFLKYAMNDLRFIMLDPCVSTVHWCLQGACNGDSNRAFIRRDLTKVPAEYASTVLGHTRGSWFCTRHCSCYGMPALSWDHSPRSETWYTFSIHQIIPAVPNALLPNVFK